MMSAAESLLEKEAKRKTKNLICAVILILCAFSFHGLYVIPNLWSMADLPVLPDLLFETLPFVPGLGHAADALWVSLLLYFFVINRDDHDLLIYFAVVAGIVMFVRSICILLNPSMPPLGMTGQFTFTIHEFAPGMFFSGHAANSLLIYLMMPVRRAWVLFASLVVSLCMIVSHAHYSIDIVGGYAVSWSMYCLCEKYLRRTFLGRV